MAYRYYYERPVDGNRPPSAVRDGRAAYYDPNHVAFQDPDPRHHRSPENVRGAPAATSTSDGRRGAQAVHDPYRRDWREQDRGNPLNARQGVVPPEEVHAHPNPGGRNGGFAHGGHDGRPPQVPAHNPAQEHLPKRKIVSLWVPLCCNKCEHDVKKHLQGIDGVENVVTDQVAKKVDGFGTMTPDAVLSRARKVKELSNYWSGHHAY